jgi:hypothetical protein
MMPKRTESRLFDTAQPPKAKRKPPTPSTPATRIVARWCDLFKAAYGRQGAVTPRDGKAAKRLAELAGEAEVLRLLPVYFSLRDPYIASEGYPLSLMEARWNKLVACEQAERSRVPDEARTSAYLRRLKER